MPLIRKAIIIDPLRWAEGHSTVGAAREHHVGCTAPGRQDAAQHVNVVVSRPAGAVNRQEHLPTESNSIYPALNEATTKANSGVSVKRRRLAPELRVARANAA